MFKVLVIIPTQNAGTFLERMIKSLDAQTINSDILVIDSQSNDITVSVAINHKVWLLQIQKNSFNHASTRNIALKYDVDFYLFMTQDALPVDVDLVKEILKPFEDPEVVVSYAQQVPYESADEIERFARKTNYPDRMIVKNKESLSTLGIKTFFSSNSCAMYRADYFKKVCGFKEGLIMNEDMEYVARAIMDDKKVVYCADAKVYHSHNYAVRDIFKRYFDIGIFFKTNSWISEEVDKYTKTESTGVKQAIAEVQHLWQVNKTIIPKSIFFSLTKYLAFKLGFYYQKLPMFFKQYFSLHKNWHH